ncbi:MAG: riboflavin biosynthesis protein RibD [Dyadobacter sp. 50-39]|uniref:dihydrofolate reductase family protein n=1 Tax=Dyadobacter sp. 50-39 TaxID=1895756 RepID=UPI00096592A6|nr:dihydrofolate reductase family protein [Dyadobacter sp. 50-39]OJV14899.1 MAG: riboflavin biosynthesis protein RibD [Dyadobacter sp. 50-39]
MGKIIAITQLSVDGVMQAPGGPDEDTASGFKHGGWFMHYGDDLLHKALDETISGEFEMLLGRRTYDIFASYWPHHDENPIGKAFNKAKKYIATRTLEKLDWNNAYIISEVVEEVGKLRASDGPDIHIWGSSNLLQTLISAGLVDEHRLWIAPVVLGGGKRLFENGVPAGGLTLVDTQVTSTGMIMNTYRPSGKLPGSAPEAR